MKRIFTAFTFAIFSFLPLLVFAQTAVILDLKGDVLVKEGASSKWGAAEKGMLLKDGDALKTGAQAECTLAFDEKKKNIISLKGDSQIKIDSVSPGNIYLPEGRVFSIIKNLQKGEKFEIRTPTAIAGARGTGWFSDAHGESNFACFQDTIYVQGLDNQGNSTGEEDVDSGFGIDVEEDGSFGETFALGDADYREWNDFSNQAENLGTEETGSAQGDTSGSTTGASGTDNTGTDTGNSGQDEGQGMDTGLGDSQLDDLLQQQSENIREGLGEDVRQSQEAGSGTQESDPYEVTPPPPPPNDS